MKKIFAIAFFISVMCGFGFAQSALPTLEKIKPLKLLESTPEDAIRLLDNEEVSYSHDKEFYVSHFYAEDANVAVSYSNGNCSDEDEDWNVPEWKITDITISPRNYIEIGELGIDYSTFRKERPKNDYKKLYVYHNKKAGIAIWVYGDRVESIIFSPAEKDFPRLCNKSEVKNYYSSKKYVRDPDMKNSTYHNFPPPDVISLNLSENEIIVDYELNNAARNKDRSNMEINVSTEIRNPMNDVILYDYRISGGKINGKGAKVIWDLSGVKPGIYKITAIANNGCGPCGKWITKMVVIS